MPLSNLQSHVLRTMARQRSPDSYVAGGVAINRDGPRYSGDIDIFHDGDDRLAAIAARDGQILGETTELEWVADADFRFFPALSDALFGYGLHPADLATNKASAAADRRVSRDIVDLVTLHDRILPLGAIVTAAVGRFPGMTPEEMLDEIRRRSTFTADEFEALATEAPLDVRQTHQAIKVMLDDQLSDHPGRRITSCVNAAPRSP